MDVNFVIITLWIVVLNDFKARSQVSLEGPAVAIQGSEYTLTCKTNNIRRVEWYKDGYIGYSDRRYNSRGCNIDTQANTRLYEFKDCGENHKLTIKSIDYDRDNGTVWKCQYHNGYWISSSLTVKVLALTGPVVAIQGTEYTLECKTDLAAVNWYKGSENIGRSNNQYDNSACYFNIQTGRNLYEFKDCGAKHKLTIKSIDYDRDNGRVWKCQYYNGYWISSSLTVKVLALAGPVTAIQGTEYTLECKTDLTHVAWYKGSDYIGQSETDKYNNLRCYFNSQTGRNLYEFKDCGVKHKLTIKSIDYNRDNGTVWRCQEFNNQNVYSTFTMYVIILPKFTTSSSPIVGQSFDLTCVSTYPVSWFRKTSDENINSYIGTSSVSKYGCSVKSDYKSNFEFKSCGSVYQTLTVTSVDFDRDNGSTWRCETTNRQSSDSYTMIVTAPVTSVEIKSTNLNSSILSVEESQQFVIQCVTSFAYPEPTVDLFICNGMNNKCDTYTTNKSGKTKTAITFQVLLNSTLKLDDTRVYCSARNLQTVIISNTVILYILHHPKIRVQADDGHLLCIAEGRPENMTFLPWKHSIDNKLVREIEGYYINTTVYSLNITNNQIDEGSYTCTVYNGIPDPVTKQLDQMTSYQLNLHVEPSLYNVESSNNLQVGNNGGFSFEYLQDNTVNVSWNRDGQKLENNSRVTISEEPTEISHPYNNNITLSGIKTTLTITSIIITDQGNYICDICNQYGCSHRIFELNVALLKKQTNEDVVIDVNTTIIVASVVSTVILICVVVVIFIAILRRRTKSNGPSVEKRETDYNRQNTSADNPVEMEIIENDLYISSDLLDNENTKEPPVYTQVKKTSKNETTYDNNVPSDNFPEYGIVQKKKGKDKTKNHDKDIVYYNTSSEAVSSAASDFNNVEADPYINAEYLNRKQLEIRNS